MAAYYNEFDPYAAQWLRNLIAKNLIAPGDVDERSITEVQPDDLRGYDQCHFFAGIGGWSEALRLAGWPDDRPVWTGSCPCQPFSTAGKQRGSEDERHLWPAFFRLIRERRPSSVFGEQVAGAAGLAWLDHVCADLEDEDYAAAAADLCAAGSGAPHIRQRLYWVANTLRGRAEYRPGKGLGEKAAIDGGNRCVSRERLRTWVEGETGCVGNPQRLGPQRSGHTGIGEGVGEPWAQPAGAGANDSTGPTNGYWRDADWIFCRDGKWRPVEPGTFPLATGIPKRMGRVRAYGNSIVPQVAAAFVTASLTHNAKFTERP